MRNRIPSGFSQRSMSILLLSALMLSGCAVGPNYHRPVVHTPEVFHGPADTKDSEPHTASAADLPWWQVFHDPQLQELIRTALNKNYDMQLAVERVNAARAQVDITRSNEFPMVSLNPSSPDVLAGVPIVMLNTKRNLCTARVCLVLIVLPGMMFLTGNRGLAVAQCADINAPETVAWVNALIATTLGEDTACRTGAPDRDTFATSGACNIFVGRVMARIYGLTTFVSADHSFLKANQIAGLIPTWDDWLDLGTADQQSSLAAAGDAANLGYLVIAVWANPAAGKPGHVALIGPGPLTTSPKWGNLRVPVAASFALDDVESAFMGQPLSCAIGSAKKSATHLWKYKKTVSPR